MDPSSETEPGPAPRAPIHRSRLRRALLWTAAGLGALAVVLVAVVLFTLKTETGAVLAWRAANEALPGNLSGEVIGGTLDGGVALRNVVYTNDGLRIAVNRLEARWELLRSPLLLHVRFARADQVVVTLPPDDDDQPAPLPARLTLPFALRVDQLSINKLTLLREGRRDQFSAILAQGRSDGVQHTLVLERASTPFGRLDGKVALSGVAPYGVKGAAVLTTTCRAQSYRIEATLGGNLRALDVRLRATGGELTANARLGLAPFADVPLNYVLAEVASLDPHSLNPDWPSAELRLNLALRPPAGQAAAGAALAGTIALDNAQPGPLNNGMIPLASAKARLAISPALTRITDLDARLAGGAMVQGEAVLKDQGGGAATLRVRKLDLHALHADLGETQLAGPVTITRDDGVQHIRLALEQASLGIAARIDIDPARFVLQQATLRAGRGQLALSGTLGRGAGQQFSASGTLSAFNPAALAPALAAPGIEVSNIPAARINGTFNASGELAPGRKARLRFDIADSSYSGHPLRAKGVVALAPGRLTASDANIVIAGNEARIQGSFGAPSDRLTFAIDAPAIDRLGFALAGKLAAQGRVAGSLTQPVIDATVKGSDLAYGNYRLAAVQATLRTSGLAAPPGTPLRLVLEADGLRTPVAAIDTLALRLQGQYGQHTLDARLRGTVRDQPLRLQASARGALAGADGGPLWRGVVTRLENTSAPRLSLLGPLEVSVAADRIALGAARMLAAGATIDLNGLVYSDALIRSSGAFTSLNVGHLLSLRQQFTGQQLPLNTDMVLDGRWNLTLAERADGIVQLSRRSGDIRTRAGVALNLDTLVLSARLNDRRIAIDARLASPRFGSAHAGGRIGLLPAGGRLAVVPASPINGTLRVVLPQLQALGALAGPRIAVSGRASALVTLDGSLADPLLLGSVAGEQIGLTIYDYGLALRDGSVRLRLADNMVVLEQAVFQGGGGALRASGRFPLDPAGAAPAVSVVADQLQVLSGPNGTLTLSGKASAAGSGARTQVTGAFVVDRARLSLPPEVAPRLGGDVVVIRDGKIERRGMLPPWLGQAGALVPAISVRIGLGDDFYFEGAGADLQLAGQLLVTRDPAEPLQVFGTVRVVEGIYEAFGTELEIEQGIISFQGEPQNPAINILATRAGRDVEAGIRLSGTVSQPRVQVVSEPPVSEAESLSRLVLGNRGDPAATGRARGAAQAVGLGLVSRFFGGSAAEKLRLDELSLGSGSLGTDGGQVINIGKELSERLYLAYEQSLSGSGSVLMLTYELSRFWSVVLFGGTVGGAEVLYDRRFDQLRPAPNAGRGDEYKQE